MKTVLLLLLAGLVLAATTASAADPATDALAAEYLALTGSQAKFDASLQSYAEELAFVNPGADKKDILAYLKESVEWDVLKGPAAGLVSAAFTADELKQLNAFLKTPAGQTYARKSPGLAADLAKLVKTSIEKAITEHNENTAPPMPH